MDREIDKEDVQSDGPECQEAPCILEEITIEEMAVDGICGIY
jgi:mycofactocin precursor